MKSKNRDWEKKAEGVEGAKEPIRVTDRRRILLDENGSPSAQTNESPKLKPTYVEELEARTMAAEKLVQEVQARFNHLREDLQRETDETRRRLNRAADDRAEREIADFIAVLLPVMDNLARAIEAAESSGSLETIVTGIRGTVASFDNALAAAGVSPIETLGQTFDPELHEAVDTVEVEAGREGRVEEEYSRGFRMGERLLRPARVKVGRSRPAARDAVR